MICVEDFTPLFRDDMKLRICFPNGLVVRDFWFTDGMLGHMKDAVYRAVYNAHDGLTIWTWEERNEDN